MVCIALNGFHGKAKYQWYKDNTTMDAEEFPVIYVALSATYFCEVTVDDHGGLTKRSPMFVATGM